MKYIHFGFILSLFLIDAVLSKESKAIGIFNIVKFPNDSCDTGSNRNGTCYTEQECSDKGGIKSGSCADGYGVCCVVEVACGGSTSENCTYLEAPSTISSDSTCQYQVCPLSSDISRIRLDLTTFTIAGPVTAALNGGVLLGGALGDCVTDTFTLTGSTKGSPVICGSNSGQHIFVDTDGSDCISVNFVFGADTFSRSYDIKVLQFDKRNEMGGPQGCLQFYSGTSGILKSFNYVDTSISSSHLSSQDYDICIRRGADMCIICYSPTTGATPASFGLSVSTADAAQAAMQSNCITDFLMIPEGNTKAIANSATVISSSDLFCGRFFSITVDATASATVCSRKTPFRVSFFTNANEVDGATDGTDNAADKAMDNELSLEPRGNLGFSLAFFQEAC